MPAYGELSKRQRFAEAAARRLKLPDVALFLDVDGTLLELAAKPDAVVVEPGVVDLLRRLSLFTEGALALVSGRNIAVLDALFAPLMLPSAGLHGFERRNATGVYCRRSLPPGSMLERARRLMGQVAARHPALVLEDKRFAVALHYREVPALEHEIVADVMSISQWAGSQLEARRGKMVIELLPGNAAKGQAVAEFMTEPPFVGRRPLYLGDDLTDESAFQWVNSSGGLSVGVNVAHPTAARLHLGSVTQAHAWLEGLLEASH